MLSGFTRPRRSPSSFIAPDLRTNGLTLAEKSARRFNNSFLTQLCDVMCIDQMELRLWRMRPVSSLISGLYEVKSSRSSFRMQPCGTRATVHKCVVVFELQLAFFFFLKTLVEMKILIAIQINTKGSNLSCV